jgi:membrane protein YqaA with SNARE-associated domain
MWEILGGLLVGTAVSGLVPLVNAEILVAGAAVAAPGIGIPVLALVSTLGQMTSKTLLFGAARWAPARLPNKARAALDAAANAVARRGGAASSLVFTSAAVGLPPFYGVSLAAGALGMRLRTFVVSGGVGRAARFATMAWLARHVGEGAMGFLTAHLPIGG